MATASTIVNRSTVRIRGNVENDTTPYRGRVPGSVRNRACRAARKHREETLTSNPGEHQAERRATHGQQNTFSQELARDAAAARAEREARRDLLPPSGRTHEKEIGDVRARDQQDEANDAHQDQQRRSESLAQASPACATRHDVDSAAMNRWRNGPAPGIAASTIWGHATASRPSTCASESPARRRAITLKVFDADNERPRQLGPDRRCGAQGHRDLRDTTDGRAREAAMRDADDRDGSAEDDDRLTNRVWLPAQSPLPIAFGDDRNRGRARAIVLWRQEPTGDRAIPSVS